MLGGKILAHGYAHGIVQKPVHGALCEEVGRSPHLLVMLAKIDQLAD